MCVTATAKRRRKQARKTLRAKKFVKRQELARSAGMRGLGKAKRK